MMSGFSSSRSVPTVMIMVLLLTSSFAGCLGSDTPEAEPRDVAQGSEDAGVDHRILVDIDAVPCPAGYNNYHDDDVCLGYNGQIPGPTWVFEQDQHVEIVLRHNVTASLAELEIDVDDELAERLSQARYSMHRHGLSLDACSDGVAKINGTEICDSTVGPGETVTYTFNTSFPGGWHYHDHGLAFNGEPANGPILGTEAEDRGLWGSFLVLEEGESTDHVLDFHVLDPGINGGMGLDETVKPGDRVDLLAVGLGERSALETVTLTDPDGEVVDKVLIGPGVSRGLSILAAQPGAYTWTVERSTSPDLDPIASWEGTITVEPGSEMDEAQPVEQDGAPEQASVPPGTTRTGFGDAGARAQQADRTFVIPFDFELASAHVDAKRAAGMGPPSGLPLLEAYAGETLAFQVANSGAFQHVFHMHGHPWVHPGTGETIDAIAMEPGDTHEFTVTAGLEAGHAGDWFYHCHIGVDVGPMWSVLRVYEHSMDPQGPLTDLRVMVEDAKDRPVQGAQLSARWIPEPTSYPMLTTVEQGVPVAATISEPEPGRYAVKAEVPEGESGQVVIESTHTTGDSLLRLNVGEDGTYLVQRDVDPQPEDALHNDDDRTYDGRSVLPGDGKRFGRW